VQPSSQGGKVPKELNVNSSLYL